MRLSTFSALRRDREQQYPGKFETYSNVCRHGFEPETDMGSTHEKLDVENLVLLSLKFFLRLLMLLCTSGYLFLSDYTSMH
jgi:hypothetical protein